MCTRQHLMDLLRFLLIMTGAVLLSMLLSRINDDNNPFAMAIFILAVALTARCTHGSAWGIAAALIGTLCVNYFFTYPFWTFDITYTGYPLTFAVMLIVSLIISTLTSAIKRQEELKHQMEREKMHANLLRAIAHDIRTPLAAILGASSSLESQKLSPADQATLISGIRQDAQWLVRVTENLLSVTRLSGDTVQLHKQEEVLEEIVGSAIHKYHATGGSLPVHVDPSGDILVIPMDPMLIEQVLINLFDNVSAHASGASAIWLHLNRGETDVHISVEDDGPGIPAALLPGIFDGTISSSGTRVADGRRNMGIGLSVCRSIVMAHGGTLTGSKSVHGGAALCFSLPLTQEEAHHGSTSK
ncbi:MAG: DUF4118 domain-containing protein [Clostridia bacterium]|nr:DUF4118 domain-containing protein [Clostridia bacterium]